MLTRREFGTALSVAPILAAARAAAQDDVYERAIVIDALANPGSMNVSWPPRGPLSQKQRDAIAASGITAINVTVSADFEGSVRNIGLWQGEADKYPTLLSIVRRHSDVAKAKKDWQEMDPQTKKKVVAGGIAAAAVAIAIPVAIKKARAKKTPIGEPG